MPEIAAAEQEHVIFYGYLPSDQTRFVITRPVPGQITFRLLHPVLPRLQASAARVMRQVLKGRLLGAKLTVSDDRIVLYERGHDHIIVGGRVVEKPVRAIVTNVKDALLTIVPLLLFIPITYIAPSMESETWRTWTERFSTALFTTALVSALGLLTTYVDIRRNRTIAWKVTDPSD